MKSPLFKVMLVGFVICMLSSWLSLLNEALAGAPLKLYYPHRDCLRSYRQKVQKYASEEKRLFEDLRHGLVLGSKQFVEKIRKRYAPAKTQSSIPQQEQVAKTFDPENYLRRGQQIFECDIAHFVQAKRLSGGEKEIRDVLLYGIWRTGQLKNEHIGSLFWLSYSGVSHAVKSVKRKLAKNRRLQIKFDHLNSLFKL